MEVIDRNNNWGVLLIIEICPASPQRGSGNYNHIAPHGQSKNGSPLARRFKVLFMEFHSPFFGLSLQWRRRLRPEPLFSSLTLYLQLKGKPLNFLRWSWSCRRDVLSSWGGLGLVACIGNDNNELESSRLTTLTN